MEKKREKAVRALAKHIDKALAYHREYDHGFMYVIIFSIKIYFFSVDPSGIMFVEVLDHLCVVQLVDTQEII